MNSEKEIVLKLAREKYKTQKGKKYGIGSIEGTCLIDALIEIEGLSTSWVDAKNFLVRNFNMVHDKCYGNEYENCLKFLKNFKFEQQKTMKNE